MAIINNNYHPKKWESVYRRVSMIFISYFIIFPGVSTVLFILIYMGFAIISSLGWRSPKK
jgi:hypothetical protein